MAICDNPRQVIFFLAKLSETFQIKLDGSMVDSVWNIFLSVSKRISKAVSAARKNDISLQNAGNLISRDWKWEWSECETEPHVYTRPIRTPRSSYLKPEKLYFESNVNSRWTLSCPLSWPQATGWTRSWRRSTKSSSTHHISTKSSPNRAQLTKSCRSTRLIKSALGAIWRPKWSPEGKSSLLVPEKSVQ